MQATLTQYAIFKQEIKSLREKLSTLREQDTSDPMVKSQIKNIQGQLRKKNQAIATLEPLEKQKISRPKTDISNIPRKAPSSPVAPVATENAAQPQSFNSLGSRFRAKITTDSVIPQKIDLALQRALIKR